MSLDYLTAFISTAHAAQPIPELNYTSCDQEPEGGVQLFSYLQAAQQAGEAEGFDQGLPLVAPGSPLGSPRGSLTIRMEPLQECASPNIVVRTRLSLCCPTPGHLLSA